MSRFSDEKGDIDDQVIVDRIYSSSVEPDRFDHLLKTWDERMRGAAYDPSVLSLLNNPAFLTHVRRADDMLDRAMKDQGEEAHVLVEGFHSAAMLISERGEIIAANTAATAAFGMSHGSRLDDLPLPQESLVRFRASLARVARAKGDRQDLLHMHRRSSNKPIVMLLQAVRTARSATDILAVSTEYAWSPQISALLQRGFELTPAELNVLRMLISGDTVAGIATEMDRSVATIRSQLHSLLGKTGTRSQSELVRLAIALLATTALRLKPTDKASKRTWPYPNRFETLVLPDGRNLDFIRVGRQGGSPFLWLHGPLACARLPAPAERRLDELGLTMIVPVKAGYGYSSPAPRNRSSLLGSIEDLAHLKRALLVGPCPVVANSTDLQLAVALHRADPASVTSIIGVSAGFPITTAAEYARLSVLARIFRANARFAPHVLPFLTKMVHAIVRLKGIDAYVDQIFASPPADAAAIRDPVLRAAVIAGYQIVVGYDVKIYDAFTADVVAAHRDWHPDFNTLDIPLTFLHGELDSNHSIETVRDYCRRFPAWRLIEFSGEGFFAPLVHWPLLVDLIAEAAGKPPSGDAGRG